MSIYLIYHPPRAVSCFDTLSVYHDSISGNQDPFIWNKRFLHSYCHITQMSSMVGDINFLVSGNTFPNFSHPYCDLLFVVAEKIYWSDPNNIAEDDKMVDSLDAYNDHYRRGGLQHPLKLRRLFTLKADPARSFQPQDANQRLIDIVPYLSKLGVPIDVLRQGLRAGFVAKQFRLTIYTERLYSWLNHDAAIKLTGEALETIRKQNTQLASP